MVSLDTAQPVGIITSVYKDVDRVMAGIGKVSKNAMLETFYIAISY